MFCSVLWRYAVLVVRGCSFGDYYQCNKCAFLVLISAYLQIAFSCFLFDVRIDVLHADACVTCAFLGLREPLLRRVALFCGVGQCPRCALYAFDGFCQYKCRACLDMSSVHVQVSCSCILLLRPC